MSSRRPNVFSKCCSEENTGSRIKKCRNNAKYYSRNGYYKSCEKHKKDDMIKIGVCDSCDKKAYYSNRITGTPTKCKKHKENYMVHVKPKICQYTEKCENKISRQHKINGCSLFCKEHHDFVEGKMRSIIYEYIRRESF